MSVRAILLAVVLVAATCRADETTSDYPAAADPTDRPESTEDEVRSDEMKKSSHYYNDTPIGTKLL